MLVGHHEFILGQGLFSRRQRRTWPGRWDLNFEVNVLHSYGVAPEWAGGARSATGRAGALRAAMPSSHQNFIRDLPWLYEDDRIVAVHAGLDTQRSWDDQRQDLVTRTTENPRGPAQLCLVGSLGMEAADRIVPAWRGQPG